MFDNDSRCCIIMKDTRDKNDINEMFRIYITVEAWNVEHFKGLYLDLTYLKNSE